MVSKGIKKLFGHKSKKSKSKSSQEVVSEPVAISSPPVEDEVRDEPKSEDLSAVTEEKVEETVSEEKVEKAETEEEEPSAPAPVEEKESVESAPKAQSVEEEPVVVEKVESEKEESVAPVEEAEKEEPAAEEPAPEPVAIENKKSSFFSRSRSAAPSVATAPSEASKAETVETAPVEEPTPEPSAPKAESVEEETFKEPEEKEDEVESPVSLDSTAKITRVDSKQVDITLAEDAKSGDVLDVEHGDETKTIKVPRGAKAGEEFSVKLVDETAPEPAMCGCF